MNILIDIGNTFTHVGVAGKTRILSEFKFTTHERLNHADIMKKLNKYRKKIVGAAISSVVPAKDEYWVNFVSKHFEIEPIAVNWKSELPIRIKIERPNSIGADRICNAVSGYLSFKGRNNVIVIDLGTATTYDVILKNGDFIGGIIAPGIETSAKALHSNTAKLPLLGHKQLRFPRKVIGRNTLEAIQSGLMYTTSITVDGMIKQIERDYNKKFKVVLTGGLSRVIYRRISRTAKLESNTVLKGLNYIINYNNKL